MKRILSLALALTLIFSLAVVAEASGGEVTQSTVIADFNNDGQIEVGTVDDVEVNEPLPATGKRCLFPLMWKAAPSTWQTLT